MTSECDSVDGDFFHHDFLLSIGLVTRALQYLFCVFLWLSILSSDISVLLSSSAGAGDQSNSPSVLYRGRAEVSQQLQSSCSFFLRLVQEWTESHGEGNFFLYRRLLSWRQHLLCFQRT